MNLMPLVSSNLWAARIRPRLPSLIRSARLTPWFWYFFATETTKRRLLRTSLSRDSSQPVRIDWASSTSSSRVISGYWLISRRYWSSDPSSNVVLLAEPIRMRSAPPRKAVNPLHTTARRLLVGTGRSTDATNLYWSTRMRDNYTRHGDTTRTSV